MVVFNLLKRHENVAMFIREWLSTFVDVVKEQKWSGPTQVVKYVRAFKILYYIILCMLKDNKYYYKVVV